MLRPDGRAAAPTCQRAGEPVNSAVEPVPSPVPAPHSRRRQMQPRQLRSVLRLALAFTVILPAAAWAQGTGAIRGRVTDASTGAPVADARLEIYASTGAHVAWAFADSQGVYKYPLATGSYYVATDTS